ncbi:MAG TPA: ClpX C4-type zinc finger protein [Ktedonosporobacter sp.]|nr:ClpX C4-type zinc finger protein [Ktedonosporobacter sp.]
MWETRPEPGTIPCCSFCGIRPELIEQLTQGPGSVQICKQCVALCREIIDEEQANLQKLQEELKKRARSCSICGTRCPVNYHYCYNCGSQFPQQT